MSTDHSELARAKLTRSLRIVGRRQDGLHLLESEMVTLDLADSLVFSEGDSLTIVDEIAWVGKSDAFSTEIPTGRENLVARALSRCQRTAAVRLTKRIPAGAGLGGGSADAAAALRFCAVDDLQIAASLGSDVPFCVQGGRAIVSGVGETIFALEHEPRSFVLLTPQIFVSTALVYQTFDNLERVEEHASNDLEQAAVIVEPQLTWWRDLLRDVTGGEVVLVGSGSTWFVECSEERSEFFAAELRAAVVREGRAACVTSCRAVARS